MLEIDCKHLLFDKRSKTFIGKLRNLHYPYGQYYKLDSPIRVFGNATSKTFHFARTDEDPDGPYYYSCLDIIKTIIANDTHGPYSLELYSKDDDMIARWYSLRGEELYETVSR